MRTELLKNFVEALLTYQERNLFVGSANPTKISLLAAHILVELDNAPSSRTELLFRIRADRSQLNRTLDRLFSDNFVREEVSKKDKRVVVIHLTTAGKKKYKEMNAASNARLAKMAEPLSNSQIALFNKLLKRVNDGFEIVNTVPTSHEHVLRKEIRRITRALGLFGDKFLGAKKLSVLETHILRAFRDNPKVRPKNLCERFKSPRNTISQALTRLEKRKFLKRSKSTHGDKRAISFDLTSSGAKVLAEAFGSGAKLVSGPASGLTDSELKTLVSIVQLLATGYSSTTDKNFSCNIHFSELTTEEERGKARRFLMEYLLQTKQAENAPATLIGKKDIAHALIQEDRILALLVYEPVERAYQLSMAATSLIKIPETEVLRSFSRFSIGELPSTGRGLLTPRRMPLPISFKGVFESLTGN